MSDDEPPPLEDMKDYLLAKGVEIPVQSRPLPQAKNSEKVEKIEKPKPFASGIKKGFFNTSQNTKKTPKPENHKKEDTKTEEIITIKPKKPENPLVLKEVQEVMQYTNNHTEE
jgi:hypothetical protein